MDEVLTLNAGNTHLYPGALLTHDDPVGGEQTVEAMVLFTDHSRAEAVLTPTAEAFVLRVEPYSTAAGTAIGAKTWRLVAKEAGTLVVKAAGPSS